MKRGNDVLERKNDTLYLIVFLIIAMLIGFAGAYFLDVSGAIAYLLIASIFTLLLYSIILLLYRNYKKHTIYHIYRSSLARGSYHEVASRIDSDSKEMDDVWEFKLLALFHSGNTKEFMRLYKNYMNEINECATLERYQISLLHDILLAVESPNKPVSFMKNTDNAKYKYTKSIEYQLYSNIYMGLKEYYQPQRNLVKVYFEKFLQQMEEISKPFSFYLYYLMTLTMLESNHPLCEPYYIRTQSYIYDENSLQLVNTNIQPRMSSMQKGSGYQEIMDRQREDRNFLNDMDINSSFDKSFNMEETGFRTMSEADEGFVKKRHASEFQSDFDALNASVQNNNFNLYEDNDYDEIAPRAQRAQRTMQQPLPTHAEEVDMDLDPTWFARSTIRDDEPIVTANFSMRNPRMQESSPQGQMQESMNPAYRSNQVQQDTFMNANTYQDIPVSPTYPTNATQPQQQSEPAFMNTRTYMDNNQQPEIHQQNSRMRQNDIQARNPMMNASMQNNVQQATQPQMQRRFPNQMNPQTSLGDQNPQQLGQTSQMQNQRMQNATMMQQRVVNTPQDRFSRFQQDSAPRSQINEMAQRTAPISAPVTESNEKRKLSRKEKKNAKQDPFGFDNPNAMGKDPFLQETTQHINTQVSRKEQMHQQPRSMQMDINETTSYRHFIKRNMSIAGMTLLNAVIVSIATSSFVYVQFFYKYPINSEIISEIVLLSSLVALLMTYLIAGIHTGWTILKKPIAKWSMIAKCLTSPFLLVASLLIGAVSEIPYLIYASIKASNEKAIQ